MSDRKTIQVNMDLFHLPSNKTRKKKDPASKKDIKIKNSAHNATTKNKLLRYIREQQEKNYEKLFERDKAEPAKPVPVPSVLANSNSEFEQSIAYMKTVEEEKKKKEALNTNATIKHRTPLEEMAFQNKQPPVLLNSYPNLVDTVQFHAGAAGSQETPSISLKPRPNIPAPTYGCLKNGNLPTYRSMMQQTVKNHSPHITITNPISNPASVVNMNPASVVNTNTNSISAEVQKKDPLNIHIPVNTRLPEGVRQEQWKTWSELNQLREKMQQAKQGGAPKNLKYLKRKKTLRRTYNVGKSKVHPKVSVLVTNRTIRKKISTQAQQLKQIPIEEIRRYLMEKGLIKVGSIAPNDVLRQMYENTILIGGEVNNHNPENLLYNYLNAPQPANHG